MSSSAVFSEEVRAAGRAAFEARMTAGRIRALLDSGMEVTDADTGQRRRVEPRDIVILLRSMAGRGALYENALADVGVDASSGTGGGFFGSAEAGAMLSLLAAVDNPRQDVMLIGACAFSAARGIFIPR